MAKRMMRHVPAERLRNARPSQRRPGHGGGRGSACGSVNHMKGMLFDLTGKIINMLVGAVELPGGLTGGMRPGPNSNVLGPDEDGIVTPIVKAVPHPFKFPPGCIDGYEILLELANRGGFLKGPGGMNDTINGANRLEGKYKLDLDRKYSLVKIWNTIFKQTFGDEYDYEYLMEHGFLHKYTATGKKGYNYYYWPDNKTRHPIYFSRLFLPFHKGVSRKPSCAIPRYLFHICLIVVPIWLSGHILLDIDTNSTTTHRSIDWNRYAGSDLTSFYSVGVTGVHYGPGTVPVTPDLRVSIPQLVNHCKVAALTILEICQVE